MKDEELTAESNCQLALHDAVHSTLPEVLERAAADSGLSQDFALALLKRVDLPASAIVSLSKNDVVMRIRKVRLALIAHPKAPRHIALPLLRHLYTFDLMYMALTPVVPADIKKAAEEVLLTRLEKISIGEKLSLARRASGRVAEQLLLQKEPRIIDAALENSRMTETSIVKAVVKTEASPALIHAVCHHQKWSQRRDVRIALLRNEKTPLARALEFAQSLSVPTLQQTLKKSALPSGVKKCLLNSKAKAINSCAPD
jgi:hypothetical protein